ncbi:unnamed protein product [Paramecium primaurelia]|uniref:Serine/threonine-protein phosphatase 2A activator n=1 Tax=Paramecium primaurelia TaxID=5886 RepID=A0A8S1K7W4_PARPR|nr:unnamed protein product [Paramecium primaurelia]
MNNQFDWSKHQFQQVEKKIITEYDVEKFKKTKIIGQLLEFMQALIKSVQHKKISQTKENQKFLEIQQFFLQLEELLLKVPPIQQSLRYGNIAFRDWLDQIGPIVDNYLKKQLPENLQNAAIELRTYLLDSFGNKERIDYGTGHELQFFLFLFSLFRLGIFNEQDYEGIVRLAFYRYIIFARKVQMTYMLEPAGSHGVGDWMIINFYLLYLELQSQYKMMMAYFLIAQQKRTLLRILKKNICFFNVQISLIMLKKGHFMSIVLFYIVLLI